MVYSPNKYRETEGIKVRRYGFALDEATLKQLAYKKGITQSIETMTQAQKAQLRYIAILEQAGNIGVLGDMSRTIDNSANQLRIFTARVQQFVRAVGNMLVPMISAVLPYFTAFVQLLTEVAQSIANFMGFELPRIDLNASPVKNGYDEITAATDAATAATEKFKGTLAGVDQLNIIGSKTESGTGDGTGLNYDLNLDLPSYDFLNGVESKTKEIFEGIKKGVQQVTPYLETLASLLINIGGAIALTRIGEMFKGSGGALKTFFTGGASGFVKFSAGLAGGVASMMLWKNSLKQITKQTDQWGSSLAVAIGGTVAIGAVLTAALGPVGLGITLVGALAGAFWGATEAQAELNRELADLIVYSDKGGMSISGLADGFSGYINGISNSYDDILENTKAFRDNQEAIADASNSVYNLTDKYIALGDEITSDDAAKISANIETIANSIRDNLGIATQSIVDNLKTKFSEFAHQLGMDIDDMVGKFYLLEAMGGEAIAKYKQQADTVVADILAGDTSAEKMQQLQEAVRMLSGGTTNKTLETVSFEKALQEMDFAAVDFSSAEDVKAAFDRVATAAESARNSIDEAWSGQILELDTLKSQYETWGIDIQYDEKFGAGSFDKLFADTRLAMDSSYQQELAKIDSSQALFAGMVDTELEKRINEAASSTGITLFETMAANWDNYWRHGGILSDRNYAKTLANEKHLENTRAQFADIQSIIDKNYADLGVNSEDYKAIGGYITQGLADGAIENAEQFYNSLDEIADVGANEFKEKYGIHSPSRLFAEYGGFMMAGLAQGIMDNSPSVVSSIEVLYKQMLDEMLVNQALISSQLAKGFHIDTSPDVSVYDYEAAMRPAAFDNDWSAVFNSKQSGEEEKPFVINLYSTVEIDGEAVGEAASKYEKMAAFTNNGR